MMTCGSDLRYANLLSHSFMRALVVSSAHNQGDRGEARVERASSQTKVGSTAGRRDVASRRQPGQAGSWQGGGRRSSRLLTGEVGIKEVACT